MFHMNDKYHNEGDRLEMAIRWGVLGVIRSAPNEGALWTAHRRTVEAAHEIREHYRKSTGEGWDWYPRMDTGPYRVIYALEWAASCIKDSMAKAPKWPVIQASDKALRQLETAKAERPEKLARCLETLDGLARSKAYSLYTDGDSFGFQAGGFIGGLIWHATPGEWSIHT